MASVIPSDRWINPDDFMLAHALERIRNDYGKICYIKPKALLVCTASSANSSASGFFAGYLALVDRDGLRTDARCFAVSIATVAARSSIRMKTKHCHTPLIGLDGLEVTRFRV